MKVLVMVSKGIKLLIVSFTLSWSGLSHANTCLGLLDFLEPDVAVALQSRMEVEFNDHNLKGFEMAAAMVVANLIKDGYLDLSTAEANDNIAVGKSLSRRQRTLINDEVQTSFDHIFRGSNKNGQIGFFHWAENHREGFEHEVLSQLFRQNEDFVFKFVKRNMNAIVYNGRSMTWLSPKWLPARAIMHPKFSFLNPTKMSQRAKKIWIGAASLAGILAIPAPHIDLKYTVTSWLMREPGELKYALDKAYRLLDDPGAPSLMAMESLTAAAATLSFGGVVFLVSRGLNSLRSTRNSPMFNLLAYNEEVGAKVRAKFVKEANSVDEEGDRESLSDASDDESDRSIEEEEAAAPLFIHQEPEVLPSVIDQNQPEDD